MSLRTDRAEKPERLPARMLIAGAVLCVVASGGLLWWRYGASVFNDLVLAGLAWCF
ncbi:MAG TPA: hypothetical protein VEZ16_11510 [Microvirga sp.]|nr:hypothetical protein [Microvirga sp.]